MPSNPDEKQLIAQAKAGCPDAFAALTERHHRLIYVFVYRMVKDEDDAEELTQEAFTKAFVALPRTAGDMNFNAWMHRIANNLCLDVLRRRQRRRFSPWEDHKHEPLVPTEDWDELPERSLIRSETDAMVQAVLDAMPAHHRLALILREFDGLGCAEIGEIMGKSSTAMKSLLFRARYDFRAIWRRLYGDERERIVA